MIKQLILRLLTAALTFAISTALTSWIGFPQMKQQKQQAREELLKNNLREMRKLIDQYAADRKVLPKSLDDLIEKGYIREVPLDPVSGNRDWDLILVVDPFTNTGSRGISNIRSNAAGHGIDGIPYREY